ncbi:MAG: hypothetical protein ACYC0Q_06870 [Eubacteriales bacterium]
MGRKVVAVGNLHGIWLDMPGSFSGREDLARSFEAFFNRPWGDVMLGGDMPYSFHKDWDAYVAVSGLEEGPGWPFRELTGICLKPEDNEIYRIMAG